MFDFSFIFAHFNSIVLDYNRFFIQITQCWPHGAQLYMIFRIDSLFPPSVRIITSKVTINSIRLNYCLLTALLTSYLLSHLLICFLLKSLIVGIRFTDLPANHRLTSLLTYSYSPDSHSPLPTLLSQQKKNRSTTQSVCYGSSVS